jgi:hypothetical protein
MRYIDPNGHDDTPAPTQDQCVASNYNAPGCGGRSAESYEWNEFDIISSIETHPVGTYWNDLSEEERQILIAGGESERTWGAEHGPDYGGAPLVDFPYETAAWVSLPLPFWSGAFTVAGAFDSTQKTGQVGVDTVVTTVSGLVPLPPYGPIIIKRGVNVQRWAGKVATGGVVNLTADWVNNSKPPDRYTQFLPLTISPPPPTYNQYLPMGNYP